MGRHARLVVPDVALLDPELTVGLPRTLTAATGADALTHAVEAYQSINRNPMAGQSGRTDDVSN